MGSQKSSITAEIKVAGLSAFKSDLGNAGQSASKLGKDLQAIKPITFDGGASSAKRALALREEHHRASLRVIEREEKLHQQRLQVLGNPKGGIGRVGMGGGARADGTGRGAGTGKGGGLSGGGNLAQGYNFVQDLVQGGPTAVANNIPWLVGAISQAWKSPAVIAAAGLVGAGIAAVASVGLAAKLGYDVFTEEDKAFDRSQKNRNESKKKWDKINMEKDKKAAKDKALLIGEIEGKNQAIISEGVQRKVKEIGGANGEERSIKLQAELRQARIDAIEGPLTKAKEQAIEDKRQIDDSVKALKAKAEEINRIAKAEFEVASAREKAIKDELALQKDTARTPEEINRRIELEATLASVIKRRVEAEKMVYEAAAGSTAANQAKQEGDVQKKIVDEKTNAQIKGIKEEKSQKDEIENTKKAEEKAKQTEEDNANKKDAVDKFQEQLSEVRKEGKAKEEERQKVREQMAGEERKSRMSPRQLAKQEAKDRIAGKTEELVKQGFKRSEAEQMAKGEEGRRERTQTDSERAAAGLRPRIRGAGYKGAEQDSGLGSMKFTGLEGLAAMQPETQRKTIKGAGSKKKEEKSSDKTENPWQMLVNAMLQVKASVDNLQPNASDKSKPRSTSAR